MSNLYELFAEVLDYPGPMLAANANECADLIAEDSPEGAELMKKFVTESAARNLGQLEEIYAKTFDLRPDCTPNASYHLFGDDWRRSMFLAELKGIYGSNSFETGNELPDHLCLILRFIAKKGRCEETNELREQCVIPAVRHMLQTIDQAGNLYKDALEALLSWLGKVGADLVRQEPEVQETVHGTPQA